MKASLAGLLTPALLLVASVLAATAIPVMNYEADDNGPVYIVRDGKRYSARQMARSADFRNLISYERIWQSSSDGSVVIPYKFTAWEGVEPNRPNFTKAMEEYEAGSCIVFREMDAGEKPSSYMELINDKSCSANVGRVTDGPTWVSVRDSCGPLAGDPDTGYLHELGHALGLYHEQARSDRDDYLVVIGDNFPNKTIRQNYQKRPTINFDVPYDYSSVLQYYDVFSDTNPRYMLTKDVRFQYQMGSSDGHLSFMNLKLVNRILSCDKLNLKNCGKGKDPCLNQGYLGASCKCVCPPGTKGDNCETLEMSYNDALIKMKSPETQYITEPNTVVETIGYPKAEENTWRLYTLVLKADKCKRAVLTFEDFQLSRRSTNGRCMRDALEIRTKFFKGDYDNFCGEDIKKGQVFKSEENDLILHVRSVKPKDNRGWKANFTIEAIKNCPTSGQLD